VKKGLNRFGGKLSKEEGGISLKDSQKKRIFGRSDFVKSIGIIHPRHPVIFPDKDWDVRSPPQQSISGPLPFSGVIGSLGSAKSGPVI